MPEMREMPDSPQESPEPEPALKRQDPEARASFAQGRPSTQIDAGEPLANAPMDPDRQVDWNSFVGN